MGTIRVANFQLPGSYGLNTQDEVAADQALRFASTCSNGVIDASGKLVARKDFNLQTSGFTGTVDTLYVHRLDDGTENVYCASSGIIYTGIATLTSRFDYRAGSQIVDVGGAKTGASATGLANDATTYGILVSVDGGVNQQVTVTGSAAQTYTNLLTQINADLTGVTVALVGGNLKFTSATTGASSAVAITNSAGTASNVLLTTLTNYVAVRTATAGTVTRDNWQFATLNDRIFMAQAGQAFTCLLESSYAVESIVGQPWTSSPNCVIAAYGRLWAADDAAGSNRYTVWWSDLLDGKTWNAGDAGSISLQNAWPQGQDSIVALAAFSSRLVIFGRNSILMYTLPSDNDPASMTLTDVISNVGCVARDSVVVTEDGVYFLADGGVYRIDRLGTVTSLMTLPKISTLVDAELNTTYASETMTAVRGGYYPKEGWYVLNAPVANKTYCFNLRKKIPQVNIPVVTTWTNSAMPFRGFAYDKDGNWYCAGTNGIFKYSSYTPDGSNSAYTFDFYTQWLAFGDESRLKHMKYAVLTLKAASGQAGTFKWQTNYLAGTTHTASFTCDATEFAEDPGIGGVKVHLTRSANVVRAGFSFTINGDGVELHQLALGALTGRTTYR